MISIYIMAKKIRTCIPVLLYSFFLIITGLNSQAQSIGKENIQVLAKMEDSLKLLSDSMINGDTPATRFRADSNFVRGLVRALKLEYSFDWRFDSLQTISRFYAPDSAFRIFTWQLKKDEYVYLQKGAIQMKTSDGSLKLFSLFDYSMYSSKPLDSVRSRTNWIGAIYYKVVLKEFKGKKYYTLIGFDDFNVSSNKKWIEVLTFNNNQEPVFGGPFFSFKEDTLIKPLQARFNIEYKKEAAALMNYDSELDLIVYDHLISESDEPTKKNTYVPDGTYEGFKWRNGQWVHVDRVFDFQLKDGEFPVENKIRDDQGNINEQLLEDASKKNMEKQGKTSTPEVQPVKKKPGSR